MVLKKISLLLYDHTKINLKFTGIIFFCNLSNNFSLTNISIFLNHLKVNILPIKKLPEDKLKLNCHNQVKVTYL